MTNENKNHRELNLFVALALGGVVAALVHVDIPHTDAVIDGRWVFGFMGFALMGRWWAALALAALLSYPYGTPDIPLWVGFGGNMLYAVPALLTIRPISRWMLRRWQPGVRFGLGWIALVMFCYQAFKTPAVGTVMALLAGRTAVVGVLDGWRTQPFLIESVLVALFSAVAMVAALVMTQVEAQRRRLERMNAILRAIRNVNQLITKEQDRGELIHGACANLTGNLAYHSAWIMLLDPERGGFLMAASNGFDDKFEPLRERLEDGEFPDCVRAALADDKVHIVEDPRAQCVNCPVSSNYAGYSGLARRLAFDGKTYGLLSVSVPRQLATNREEQTLLDEIASDIAFGLHKIEIDDLNRHEHELLRLVIEGSRLGTWSWNVNTNETVFNAFWAEMLGYTIEELRPSDFTTWKRLVHPEDLDQAVRLLRKCVDDVTPDYECEFRMKHKDGHWVWILDKGRVMTRDANGKALSMYGSHTDITERKERQQRITLLDRMLDEAPACVSIHDTGGRFFFANAKTIALHGYDSLEEFMKVNLHQLDAPESEVMLAERFRKITEVGEACFEVAHYRKDGSTFPLEVLAKQIEWEGRPAILSIATDISDRKQADQALKTSEASLKEAQRLAEIGNWSWDLRTGELFMSEQMYAIIGLEKTPDALDVATHERHYTPESWRRFRSVVKTARETGKPYEIELEVVRDSGDNLHVVARGEASKDENGQVVALHGTLQNITEQRNLENQLAQAQKMESMGRLAGGMAHDFNNMLGVILGYTEMALRDIDPAQPLFAELREVRKAGERSANLTRQLLAFARKQTIAPRIIDLNETMEEILKMLRRLIGENIDLVWQPGPNPTLVFMDPSQIDQILANLCVNARDAIAEAGKLTIETDSVSLDEEYRADHAEFISGDFIMLTVSDDGCGMDKESLNNIFEPFFTTKGVGEGTGLGLATVYGIVRQNGGFINVYSEPDQGTTFKIYLPSRVEESAKTKAPETTKIPVAQGETVMVVEDEASILELTRTILEDLGYTVLAASTPAKAEVLAKEHSGSIDLLITDVVMPGINGKDLAERLKNHYPDLKVMFMSGYTADVIAHQGVLDEGVHFIQKPFSNRSLAVKAREALN